MRFKQLRLVLAMLVLIVAVPVMADWIPSDGHKMHWPQYPDEQGWDVNATFPANLADDFRCEGTGPILGLHFWGSWKDFDGDGIGDVGAIDYFDIRFFEDIPADPASGAYSRPGALLWEASIDTWAEVPIDPPLLIEHWFDPFTGDLLFNNHGEYFQYNLDLASIPGVVPFEQVQGTIYWVSITAHVAQDPTGLVQQWGWKSTIDHFNDDATFTPDGDWASWTEMYEPPRYNEFAVAIDGAGGLISGGGTNFFSDGTDLNGWYEYPLFNWWNIWFYDNPFRADHYKEANISMIVEAVDLTAPSEVTIAVNFSTDYWSDQGIDRPPLPSDPDEPLTIGRTIIWRWTPSQGLIPPTGVQVDEFWTLTDYNPEWISIDVQGFNFKIRGNMTHECVQTSLDLSFVITGADPTGACCWQDGSCTVETQIDCATNGGTYLGDGTACLGDSNGDGIDDACGAGALTGACCLQDGSCIVTTATFCAGAGGSYLGDNSVCLGDADGNGVDDACETPAKKGACCWKDGSCTIATAAYCVQSGGDYLGDNTACLGDADGNGVDDACEASDPDFKWEQLPDIDPTGFDVNATFSDIQPYVLADDFNCTVTGPITRIHVYGSWFMDYLPPNGPNDVRFVLSIHEDIPDPDGPGPEYSKPGPLLCLLTDLEFEVQPYATDLKEGWFNPPFDLQPVGDKICWEYTFYLPPDICIQEGTPSNPKVYWLDVQAYPSANPPGTPQAMFGWKSSLQHWNDDGTWALGQDVAGANLNWQELIYPPGHPMVDQSVDLAFKIIGSGGVPTPVGACCWPDGSCTIETQADCENSPFGISGTYQGDGTACLGDNDGDGIDDACGQTAPSGACCYDDAAAGPTCVNTTLSNCIALGGAWYVGQDCNDPNFSCPNQPPQGVCCWTDAAGNMNCTNTTESECVKDYGGTWYLGQDCATFDCPTPQPIGACCYGHPSNPLCVNTTEDLCKTQYNGTWYAGQDCASFDCPILIEVPTGACCYDDPIAGPTCVSTTKKDCIVGYGGTWYPGQSCADIDCVIQQPPTGACCYGDPASPSCVVTTQSQCLAAYGGTWYLGQDCTTFDCPVPIQLGACCDETTGVCNDGTTQIECAVNGGVWYAGLACTDVPCPSVLPEGACCYEVAGAASACVDATQSDCLQIYGGTWYPGQTCATIDCPNTQEPTGACCYGDPASPSCITTTQSDCLANYGGTWYLGQDCTTFTCPVPHDVGACCYENAAGPACIDGVTQLTCQSQFGGNWYAGQTCATIDCPTTVPQGACCFEDAIGTFSCVYTSQGDCLQNYGGTWYVGQTCATIDCPNTQEPTGACCYGDPASPLCVDGVTETECLVGYGGTWYIGQSCVNLTCPIPQDLGACCYGDPANPSCIDGIPQAECLSQFGGTWYVGQDCTTIDCPTTVELGACCYEVPGATPACVYTSQADCLQTYGGTWYAGQTCATIDCGHEPPLGACCYGDPASPSCVNTTHSDCLTAYGGTWYANTDCATFTCPIPQDLGACCIDGAAGPFCVDNTSQIVCEIDYGGIWHAGLACSDIDCVTSDPLGACCYLDAIGVMACADVTEANCLQSYGGTWYAGQSCASFTCPTTDPTGACCWPDGSCTVETVDDCENPAGAAPGTYMGDGATCLGDANANGVDDLCENFVPRGACCWEDGSCTLETQTNCESGAMPGTYLGDGSLCIGDLDGNGVDDACEDPQPDWKWLQPPDLEPTGMDVRMTEPVILADDFLCTQTGDITEVSVWASWLHDEFPNGGSPADVSFVLSLHTDVPATTGAIPVPECSSGGQGWDIIDGLPAGTVIGGTGRLSNFNNMALAGGGTLGGSITTMTATLQLSLAGSGDPVNGFNRTLAVPVQLEIHTGLPQPGEDVQQYPTEMVQLQGELFGDPDFCTFRVTAGSDFGLPSPGHTLLTRLPDGDFQVDSFFDITYRIEFQGCPGSALDGFSGSTTGSVRMDTPEAGGPDCTTPNIGHHSYPGELLCLKTVDAGDFKWEEVPVTEEDWYDPLTNTYESPGDHNCIKYTFTFEPNECTQEGTETDPIVYWLDVQAFVAQPDIYIGWKTSRSHWNDDATWNQGIDPVTSPWLEMRYPDGHPFAPSSLDLAFEVRTKTSCCEIRVGDANSVGGDEPTISDISVMIDALFIGGWANSMIVCLEEADINQSGGPIPGQADITIGDISILIDYLFITGPNLGLRPCFSK